MWFVFDKTIFILSFCFFSCYLSSCYFLDVLLILPTFFQELKLGWVGYNSLTLFFSFFFLKKNTFYLFPMLWKFTAFFLRLACFHWETHGLLYPFAGAERDLGSSEGLWDVRNWGGEQGKAVNGGRCVWGWPPHTPHTHFFFPLPQTTAWVGIMHKRKDKVVSVYVELIIVNTGSVNPSDWRLLISNRLTTVETHLNSHLLLLMWTHFTDPL